MIILISPARLFGNAGLLQALFMLLPATLISSFTSISLAAIATNRQVQGGLLFNFAHPECRTVAWLRPGNF